MSKILRASPDRPQALGAWRRDGRARLARVGMGATAVAAMLALSACGADGGEAGQTPTPEASSAAAVDAPAEVDNLDGVTVKGEFGESAEIEFDPFTITETQSEVLIEGESDNTRPIEGTDLVAVHYKGVNGRTGEVFDESYPNEQAIPFPLDQVVPGFAKGLTGKHEGDRVLIAMPGTDGYDATGGQPAAGIEVGDTLVFVVDIVSAPLAAPSGETVEQPADQPQVTGEVDDPTIDISGEAPEELVAQTLIAGGGTEVTADSTITVAYRSWIWDGAKQVDDTYAAEPETGALEGLIPGWVEGLEGQAKGSRVLLVVPPDQAYPEGAAEQGIPAGSTMVYVVDLLQVA